MQFDRKDLDILRLAGKYRWLPYKRIDRFDFNHLLFRVDLLSYLGLIGISRNKKYIKPTPQGYELLKYNGYNYDPGTKRAYDDSSALRRRLEISEIMLTALRAGIDVFQDNVESLRSQPVFYPAFSLRDSDKNIMNAANCAGFGHWGDKAYMLQCVSSESIGMYMANELRHLDNLSSVFDKSHNTPSALIFAGSSYKQVYNQINALTPSKRHGVKGFNDFWDVYQKTDIPIHLLSCDEIGATQLALMSQPDYNAKIARAAFGDRWVSRDPEIPYANGSIDGNPLIIAADMNIRRLNRVCESARMLGRTKVMVVAFEAQMKNFFLDILPEDGVIIPLSIEQSLIDKAFPGGFPLYSVDKLSVVCEIKGE